MIGARSAEALALFKLAHVSDLHATAARFTRAGELNAKRAFGWLSYQARRRHKYRPEIAARVLDDLAALAPDHVAVTGDLTHMGLASEVSEAREWLARIGPPERVTLVPGNHDAYGGDVAHECVDAWLPYLNSDHAGGALFPSLRVRGPVALIGLSSAVPTPVHLATGRAGEAQLAPLADMLRDLAARKLFRVVLVHHPPTRTHVSWRRRLEDGPALCEILARAGAELVLHGHAHRAARDRIVTESGAIPVFGVPATSSAVMSRPGASQIFAIEPHARGFAITCELRALDLSSGAVVPAVGERVA
ncbi:MAG: metallophosphoesterase [Deltaproteobacteria bacterium]|nr:metallophosphoesterase [Deltaproteobacteria bacterium]